MSRNQFVRNTLAAIQAQRNPSSSVQASSSDLAYDDRNGNGPVTYGPTRSKRSDSITSWNSVSPEGLGYPTAVPVMQNGTSDSLSVQTSTVHDAKSVPYPIHSRDWESDMESLLKVERDLISTDEMI